MTEPPTTEEGAALVALAIDAIGARLAGQANQPAVPDAERLVRPGASFVTLERAGRLRGCIGTLIPRRPLYLDVVHNTLRAMTDPRLPPVTDADWPELSVKVSVLTQPVPLAVSDRDSVTALLRPGIDGLVLTDGQRRATFLPSVWAKVPEPAAFLDGLLRKGGWDTWPDGLEVHRYTTVEYAGRAVG